MPLHIWDTPLKSQCACLSAYFQSCMVDRKHRAYVVLEFDDVKFLRLMHGLEGLELRFEFMGPILEPVQSGRDFSLAMDDSGVALWKFNGWKTETMH